MLCILDEMGKGQVLKVLCVLWMIWNHNSTHAKNWQWLKIGSDFIFFSYAPIFLFLHTADFSISKKSILQHTTTKASTGFTPAAGKPNPTWREITCFLCALTQNVHEHISTPNGSILTKPSTKTSSSHPTCSWTGLKVLNKLKVLFEYKYV